MKKASLLMAAVLLTASVIVPSVAGAEEIHLLCGQKHVTVDPENQRAFGLENNVTYVGGNKWVTQVTINSEVYMAEKFFPDGTPMTRITLNRITGILTECIWDAGQRSCATSQCQKISGAPKF